MSDEPRIVSIDLTHLVTAALEQSREEEGRHRYLRGEARRETASR